MIIDNIRDYIKKCPLLKNDKINVNYLGESPIKYTIDVVPTNPLIREYTDGGSLRQYLFVFASRESYSKDVLDNMETAKFYEEFANWIEEQDNKGNLPVIYNGLVAQSIQVLTSGYAIDVNANDARFQIQFRLIYKKERI